MRASGERTVAAALNALPDVLALHDRRMVGARGRPTRATIDHLVIAPSGVWVIDAKTHYGPLEVRRSGGILTPRVEQLFINNRDRTALVDGLRHQVRTVARALLEADHAVAVRGTLCFLGTPLPWVEEEIGGIPLVGERDLHELVQQAGNLDGVTRADLAAVIAARFVPA